MRTPHPEDNLKLQGEYDLLPEYYESFPGYPIQRILDRRPRHALNSMDNIHLGDDGCVSSTIHIEN